MDLQAIIDIANVPSVNTASPDQLVHLLEVWQISRKHRFTAQECKEIISALTDGLSPFGLEPFGQPLTEQEFEILQSVFDALFHDNPQQVTEAFQQAGMDTDEFEMLMNKFGLEVTVYREYSELEEEVEA